MRDTPVRGGIRQRHNEKEMKRARDKQKQKFREQKPTEDEVVERRCENVKWGWSCDHVALSRQPLFLLILQRPSVLRALIRVALADYIFAVAMPTNQLTLPPLQSPFLLLILRLPQQQNMGATSSAALNSAKWKNVFLILYFLF